MPIYAKLPDAIKEVDVIIAGGGTAGCVIAGRLAEADPSLSILIIEGGTNNKDVPAVRNPALFRRNLDSDSKTAIFYQANKSAALADRDPVVPSGGVLGGGSSINFMMYTRAQRWDFDSWGVEGWSSEELLPFMNKLETYHGPAPDRTKHGYDGPIHVTRGLFTAKTSQDQFIEAAARVGIPEIDDLQDLDASHGIQRWLRYIGPDGTRQDAAHRYVHPKVDSGDYPNLHVLVEAKVLRVLFDSGRRAVGVEYTPNTDYQPVTGNLARHPVASAKARKLVIVSAGAIGTPLVLERSGLGDADILERAGVDLVEEIKGVGTEYQDHHLVLFPYMTNLAPEDTLDDVLSGRTGLSTMVHKRDKRVGWNGIDISSKLRMTDAEVDSLGPQFRAAWDEHYRDIPNKPIMLVAIINCFLGDHSLVPEGQYITVGNYTAYPFSRGHVHITGPRIEDPIDFDTGFLGDANDIDLKKQVWAYKKQRELVRRTPLFRGELALGHPAFPEGSAAALTTFAADAPAVDPDTVADLVYSAEDDEAIEAFIRGNLNTTWHSIGTCRCAPREKGGVVDKHLNVYGVKGLKLADLSVPPVNVGANTNNTALAIGEKAADMIIKELGLCRRLAP